jgi:hypothetical protein
MICNIGIVDGKLHSEDTVVFSKLRELGFDVFLDPRMTLIHLGTKKFVGNFEQFRQYVFEQERKVSNG